jgi:hypothetical protein
MPDERQQMLYEADLIRSDFWEIELDLTLIMGQIECLPRQETLARIAFIAARFEVGLATLLTLAFSQ